VGVCTWWKKWRKDGTVSGTTICVMHTNAKGKGVYIPGKYLLEMVFWTVSTHGGRRAVAAGRDDKISMPANELIIVCRPVTWFTQKFIQQTTIVQFVLYRLYRFVVFLSKDILYSRTLYRMCVRIYPIIMPAVSTVTSQDGSNLFRIVCVLAGERAATKYGNVINCRDTRRRLGVGQCWDGQYLDDEGVKSRYKAREDKGGDGGAYGDE